MGSQPADTGVDREQVASQDEPVAANTGSDPEQGRTRYSQLLTARWLGLTAVALFLIVAFAALGYWQVLRGQEGNARSWGYAFQWPLFALFVVYMWIRMAREEMHPQKDPGPTVRPRGTDPLPAAAVTAGIALDEDDDDPELDDELEAYNEWLNKLNSRAQRVRR